ncbi:hypothetical protein DFP93_10981 [Aneurinibacillus soli]|uniref:Uncharacterized protein n=1 Tax=Aneurinibacillus soli TaxID=1500254 RepID=A0A0U5B392_9BACL|nr:hypothetical protein [Aneurinibacillus soli]PYE61380.1 hypothetical protein DFP93_10981 [Aneurinibacillus soli]BAU27791.1 hypothetical protein CB4_01965 [Aneurinibacillus soli]
MKKIIWFLLIVTGIQVGTFSYYNHLLGGGANGPDAAAVSYKIGGSNGDPVKLFDGQTDQVALSDSKNLVAYVDEQNTLHVQDITNNKEVYTLSNEGKIDYITWIQDNGLLLGISKGKGSNKKLIVKTAMLSTNNVRTIRTIGPVSSTSTFKKMTFSPFTNDIYILVGNKNISKLYHVGTSGDFKMENVSSYYVDNILMASTKNELFFEDVKQRIPYLHSRDEKGTHRIEKNAVALRAINDTLYYGKLDAAGNVTSVYTYEQGTSNKIIDLNQPVKPDRLLVKEDGTLIRVEDAKYVDLKTNKETTIAGEGQASVKNNVLFKSSPSGTTLINL